MNVKRLELVIRVIGGILAGVAGWQVGRGELVSSLPPFSSWPSLTLVVPVILASACFGAAFVLTPHLTTRPFFWLLQKVIHTPVVDVLAAAGGLFVGLLIGAPLAWSLSFLPFFGGFLPIVASLALGYLGVTTVLSHKREILQVLSFPRDVVRGRGGTEPARVLVDTSAIIDGRIADIARAGFVPGPLVVPRFVLKELQKIADSSDPMRRGRGRRGLEVLEHLQRQQRVSLELIDAELENGQDVDSQLVRLAKSARASIMTNDYNLNRVAGIQGVQVLNVNELANALKSVVLPGEEMVMRIIQEGKEHGQGVGYLEDGTMVVVEDGRRYLGREVSVLVLRVLQTAAGRMVFAQVSATQEAQAAS